MRHGTISLLLASMLVILAGNSLSSATTTTTTATLRPDSSKECAICHYAWVDTFFILKKGSELAPLPEMDTAATPDMCFSCHDGSNVDSRKKILNDRKHQVGVLPSDKVKIPEIFPLDEEGKMDCATCHTVHAVPTEPVMGKTIFLRTSNQNSAMCRMCHVDKDGGPENGNHPLDTSTLTIPDEILTYGGSAGSEPHQVICESCHVAHGGFTDQRLVLPLDQPGVYPVLCEACHGKTPGLNKDTGRNLFSHSVDIIPQEAAIPPTWESGAAVKLSPEGRLICTTCHTVHSPAANESLLAEKNNQDSLCLQCHAGQEKRIRDSKHDLRLLAPGAENSRGQTAVQSGLCSCCHYTHEGSGPFMWARRWDGEERPAVGICKSCHAEGKCADESPVPDTGHPIGVTPKNPQTTADFPLYTQTGTKDSTGALYCSSCHNTHQWDPLNPDNKGSRNEKGDFTNSFLRSTSRDTSLCLGCHREQAALLKTSHDLSQSAPQERNMLDQSLEQSGICGGCHLAHGGSPVLMWGRALPDGDAPIMAKLCLECHSKGRCGTEKTIGDYFHPLAVPVNNASAITLPLYLSEGKQDSRGTVVCSTCHNSHQWDPADPQKKGEEGTPADSFLRLSNAGNASLCAECHQDKTPIEGTDHDLRVSAPEERNKQLLLPGESSLCDQCHAVHNASIQTALWNREVGPFTLEGWKDEGLASENRMVSLCTSCHSPNQCADGRSLEYGLHASRLYMALLQKRSGELNEDAFKKFIDQFPIFTAEGEKRIQGDIVCSTCHDPHHWNGGTSTKGSGKNEEGDATTSFLRKDIAFTLCASCHGEEALFKFKYFHLLKGRIKEKPVQETGEGPSPSASEHMVPGYRDAVTITE